MGKDKLIALALGLVGTPYLYQGRDPAIGLDCIGLLVHIAIAAGCPFDDHTDYRMPPRPGQLEAELNKNMVYTGAGMHPGGALLLSTEGLSATHCAVYTGSHIIHSLRGRGVIKTSWRDNKPFKFVSGYTFIGVTYPCKW